MSKEQYDSDSTIQKELLRFRATPEDNRRIFTVSIFYLAVALFIGVPVWLKTTATYQADLPFWQIKSLCSKVIAVNIPVFIISLSGSMELTELSSVQSALMNSEDPSLLCGSVSPKLQVRCLVDSRQASETEMKLFTHIQANKPDFHDLLQQLDVVFFNAAPSTTSNDDTCPLGSLGDDCPERPSLSTYTIVILPRNVLSTNPESLSTTFVRRSNRHNLVYMIEPDAGAHKLSQLTSSMAKLFNSVLLSLVEMQHTVSSSFSNTSSAPSTLGLQYAQSTTQQLPASTSYDVTVTIMTHSNQLTDTTAGLPDMTQQLLNDPTTWLQTNIGDVLRSAASHLRFNIHSQRLYSVDIENLEKSLLSENRTHRYYTTDGLSTLVNQFESYLGAPQTASTASRDMAGTKPGLHLILLIAIPQTGSDVRCPLPLRFHLPSHATTKQQQVITNVAVVPQWGGLFSIDAGSPACSHQEEHQTADQLALQMIGVIRSLVGFPEVGHKAPESSDISFSPPLRSLNELGRFEHWELDAWFLRRTIESMVAVRTTMTALINLLSRFPNLVINDHVAAEVTYSLRLWSKTFHNLQHIGYSQNGTGFGHIFNSLQSAFESISGAFSDYSLLGRLYFQEDQKYGIYIPLFVPVGIGLFLSARNALRILFPRELPS